MQKDLSRFPRTALMVDPLFIKLLSLSLQDVMEKVTERAIQNVTARESENAKIVAEGARAQERKKRFQQFKNFFGARF